MKTLLIYLFLCTIAVKGNIINDPDAFTKNSRNNILFEAGNKVSYYKFNYSNSMIWSYHERGAKSSAWYGINQNISSFSILNPYIQVHYSKNGRISCFIESNYRNFSFTTNYMDYYSDYTSYNYSGGNPQVGGNYSITSTNYSKTNLFTFKQDVTCNLLFNSFGWMFQEKFASSSIAIKVSAGRNHSLNSYFVGMTTNGDIYSKKLFPENQYLSSGGWQVNGTINYYYTFNKSVTGQIGLEYNKSNLITKTLSYYYDGVDYPNTKLTGMSIFNITLSLNYSIK